MPTKKAKTTVKTRAAKVLDTRKAEEKAKKTEAKELAEKFIAAIADNDDRKVDKLAKDIDQWNRGGHGVGKVPLTSTKVNDAYRSAKGDKVLLAQLVFNKTAAHKHLWARGGSRTRRNKSRRGTRKNGF